MNKPYFSVCIPVTDREKTIYNTLCSVSCQTFRDFEVVIVECGSKDHSKEEIERFFKSDDFCSHPFEYIYKNYQDAPQTVEDWNYPLQLASGLYIAMLEGDDQYMPNHLSDAYAYLSEHSDIGLYAVGNQVQSRSRKGVLAPKEWLAMTIEIKDITPPSESIFIRTDKDHHPFLYDDMAYEYAPETDLYVRLALSGYSAYFSEKCDVIRDITPKDRLGNIWHYYVDRFTLLYKYKEEIPQELFEKSVSYQIIDTFLTSVRSRSPKKMLDIAVKIIKKTSLNLFMTAILKKVVRGMLRKCHVVS